MNTVSLIASDLKRFLAASDPAFLWKLTGAFFSGSQSPSHAIQHHDCIGVTVLFRLEEGYQDLKPPSAKGHCIGMLNGVTLNLLYSALIDMAAARKYDCILIS